MQSRVAPLGAGPPLELQVEGRALMLAGVAALSAALAIFLCLAIAVLPRTGLGILCAGLILAAGDWLSRQDSNRRWWTGSCLIMSGYALLVFFAHASFYVDKVASLDNPLLCWLIKLTAAGIAAVHATQNSALRWLSLPFSAGLTVDVLYRALASSEVIGGPFPIRTDELASLTGTVWLALMHELYRRLPRRKPATDQDKVFSIAARACAELYFVATAVSAMFVPYFFQQLQYAPVLWATLAPLLLIISWRSQDFIKHWLVMGVWAFSAVLVLLKDQSMSPFISMAVPLSGLLMSLAYHWFGKDLTRARQYAGYAFYLYGSALLAVAVPFFHLGLWDAVPFFLVQGAVLLAVALLLQDRLLHGYSLVLAVAALSLFGCLWQGWDLVTAAAVTIACYGFSLMYARIHDLKGWPGGSSVAPPAPDTLEPAVGPTRPCVTMREARMLEIGFGAAGYVTLMAGIWLLFWYPANTVSWGVASLSLILFGFAVDKIGHRASGVAGIFATCAKLWILDLSGAGAGIRTFVGFVAVGVCLITAGIFYLVEYVIKTGKPNNHADGSGTTGTDDGAGKQ